MHKVTRMERIERRVARRLCRSWVLQHLRSEVRNTRGDRLDRQVGVMLALTAIESLEPAGPEVHMLREAMARSCIIAASDPPQIQTTEAIAAGCATRWYRPPVAEGVIVFLHGGGWVCGDLDSHDVFCRRLALRTQRVVVAVDYPRAPEAVWPAPIEGCAAAFRDVVVQCEQQGLPVDTITLGGDSAGGNLATTTCQLLREHGPSPALQLLIYPAVDPHCASPTHAEFANGFVLTEASVARYVHLFGPDVDHPLGDPLHADLRGLPPAILTVAGFDPLRDEGLEYATRLADAGVSVTVLDEPGLVHGYINYDGLVAEASAAVERIGDAVRAFFG